MTNKVNFSRTRATLSPTTATASLLAERTVRAAAVTYTASGTTINPSPSPAYNKVCRPLIRIISSVYVNPALAAIKNSDQVGLLAYGTALARAASAFSRAQAYVGLEKQIANSFQYGSTIDDKIVNFLKMQGIDMTATSVSTVRTLLSEQRMADQSLPGRHDPSADVFFSDVLKSHSTLQLYNIKAEQVTIEGVSRVSISVTANAGSDLSALLSDVAVGTTGKNDDISLSLTSPSGLIVGDLNRLIVSPAGVADPVAGFLDQAVSSLNGTAVGGKGWTSTTYGKSVIADHLIASLIKCHEDAQVAIAKARYAELLASLQLDSINIIRDWFEVQLMCGWLREQLLTQHAFVEELVACGAAFSPITAEVFGGRLGALKKAEGREWYTESFRACLTQRGYASSRDTPRLALEGTTLACPTSFTITDPIEGAAGGTIQVVPFDSPSTFNKYLSGFIGNGDSWLSYLRRPTADSSGGDVVSIRQAFSNHQINLISGGPGGSTEAHTIPEVTTEVVLRDKRMTTVAVREGDIVHGRQKMTVISDVINPLVAGYLRVGPGDLRMISRLGTTISKMGISALAAGVQHPSISISRGVKKTISSKTIVQLFTVTGTRVGRPLSSTLRGWGRYCDFEVGIIDPTTLSTSGWYFGQIPHFVYKSYEALEVHAEASLGSSVPFRWSMTPCLNHGMLAPGLGQVTQTNQKLQVASSLDENLITFGSHALVRQIITGASAIHNRSYVAYAVNNFSGSAGVATLIAASKVSKMSGLIGGNVNGAAVTEEAGFMINNTGALNQLVSYDGISLSSSVVEDVALSPLCTLNYESASPTVTVVPNQVKGSRLYVRSAEAMRDGYYVIESTPAVNEFDAAIEEASGVAEYIDYGTLMPISAMDPTLVIGAKDFSLDEGRGSATLEASADSFLDGWDLLGLSGVSGVPVNLTGIFDSYTVDGEPFSLGDEETTADYRGTLPAADVDLNLSKNASGISAGDNNKKKK